MLVIHYDDELVGEIHTGALLLSSATGGLYHSGVNAATGYILSGAIDSQDLILWIRPSDFKKSLLTVNATSASELRLKTSGDIGVRAKSGQPLSDLYLTKSFDSYKNIIHPTIESPSDPGESEPG